jgi:hypothetical protein
LFDSRDDDGGVGTNGRGELDGDVVDGTMNGTTCGIGVCGFARLGACDGDIVAHGNDAQLPRISLRPPMHQTPHNSLPNVHYMVT